MDTKTQVNKLLLIASSEKLPDILQRICLVVRVAAIFKVNGVFLNPQSTQRSYFTSNTM